MNDQEVRLSCLKAAVKVWETLINEEGMDSTASEVLDAAKEFYSWVSND